MFGALDTPLLHAGQEQVFQGHGGGYWQLWSWLWPPSREKRRTRLLVGSVAKLNKVPCVYFFTNRYVAAPEQLTGEAPAVL